MAVDRDRNVWVASTIDDCMIKPVFADDHLTLLDQIVVPLDYDVSGSPSIRGLLPRSLTQTVSSGPPAGQTIRPGRSILSTNTVVDGWPVPTGSYPYNYSDMTGHVRLTVTDPTGTWTEIIDGQRDAHALGCCVGGTGDARPGLRSQCEFALPIPAPRWEACLGPRCRRGNRYTTSSAVTYRFRWCSVRTTATLRPRVQAVTVAAAPPPPVVSIQYPADGTAIPVGSQWSLMDAPKSFLYS